jgi:hypothetical protein
LIAAVSALILVFAQAVTAAHACSTLDPISAPMAQATQVDAAMPADCPAMARQANSSVNTCWAHCYADPQVDAHDYAPAPLVPRNGCCRSWQRHLPSFASVVS